MTTEGARQFDGSRPEVQAALEELAVVLDDVDARLAREAAAEEAADS